MSALPRLAAAPAADGPLLAVSDVTVRFGGITALDRVTFDVGRGETCGLIGPNGAGKTTLFNCLSRVYAPVEGAIRFGGVDLLAAPPHRIASLGIARTFQHLGLFSSMDVDDNVLVGGFSRTRAGFVASSLRFGLRREEEDLRAEASRWIARLGLSACRDSLVGSLPFGLQKRVELARAMVSRPTLLLLDEPAAGLAHAELVDLADILREAQAETGMSILLVEHHMGFVMGLCDRVVVLDFGAKIAEGPPHAISGDPRVVEAYLGRP